MKLNHITKAITLSLLSLSAAAVADEKKLEVIELVKNLNIPVIDIHQEVFYNHADILSLFPFRSR